MELPKYFYFRVRVRNIGEVEVEDASDADVVEVVRCKDCMYRDGNACDYSAVYVRAQGYCQWGRRKEDDNH